MARKTPTPPTTAPASATSGICMMRWMKPGTTADFSSRLVALAALVRMIRMVGVWQRIRMRRVIWVFLIGYLTQAPNDKKRSDGECSVCHHGHIRRAPIRAVTVFQVLSNRLHSTQRRFVPGDLSAVGWWHLDVHHDGVPVDHYVDVRYKGGRLHLSRQRDSDARYCKDQGQIEISFNAVAYFKINWHKL